MKYEREITQWVEWFRGVNNPETQYKVAERQINMLAAERLITYRETVRASRGRSARVILHAASNEEMEKLDQRLEKVFPKVPTELPDEPVRTLRQFVKELGEARAKRR